MPAAGRASVRLFGAGVVGGRPVKPSKISILAVAKNLRFSLVKRHGRFKDCGMRDPITLHEEGVEAFRAGDLAMAARLITQAIAANGGIPSFHYNLGIVHKAQGKLKKAAASYGRAIALKPDYADAHNNLGNIWKSLGETGKACASFEQALRCKPGSAETHYSLGTLYDEAGAREDAARHYLRCLECDPGDSRGVRLLLAHLGLVTLPERTSRAQLEKIYGVRARDWDRESSYFAHGLVADALQRHAAGRAGDILDIGCGTGLVGAQIRPLARRLDGVDVSPAMLEKAHAKAVYDRLEQADILFFLSGQGEKYDAVTAAAVLIHFGDLQPLFQAVAGCLRAEGLFVFTFFLDQVSADFAVASSDRLAQSGCFAHSPGYVTRLAGKSGLSVRILEQVVHEHDLEGKPVPGLLAVLQKA
jgi:predicted TPR repeat methyltransferase